MKMRLNRPHAARSLTTTLAMAFLTLSVVVLLISGSLQVFSSIQAQQQALSSEQQMIAQEATQTVSSSIQEKFSVMRTGMRVADPGTASPQQLQQVLQTLLGVEPAFRQFIFLDAQNQQAAKVSRLSGYASGNIMQHLVGQPLWQVRQGKDYIGSVYIDQITSEPLMVMAIPISNAVGEFQGTLAAEINLKFMWDLVDQLKVGDTGVAYVVDREGNLLAFADTARVLRGDNLRSLGKVQDFIRQASPVDMTPASLTTGIRGTTVVATYVPLSTPDWAVITELPWQEAYSGVIQNLGISVGILLAMALLAGLLGVYQARRLAVPIVSLTDTAGKISAGELDLQATVDGPTEVTALAGAFNSMTGQLRTLIGSLEQRVAERTAALSERTVSLEQSTKYLVALQDTTMALASNLEVNDLLQTIIARAGSLVGTQHGYVFLLDRDKGAMEMRVGIGTYARMVGTGARLGSGLAGTVWQTGEPLAVDDYQNWSGRLGGAERSQLQSVVGVPLKAGDQVVGVIGLAYLEEGRKFGPSEVEVMNRFAQFASIALENARLYQEQAALAEENSKLLQTAQQASAENRRLFEQAHQASEENRRLFEQAQRTSEELNALTRRLTGEGWTDYMTRQREDLVGEFSRAGTNGHLPRPSALEQALEKGDVVAHQQEGHISLGVPIVVRDEVLGVIALQDAEAPNEWAADEIAAVKDVAEHVGLALENARLFEQTQEALRATRQVAEREARISEISDRIYGTTDINSILRIAAEELRLSTASSRAVIRLNRKAAAN